MNRLLVRALGAPSALVLLLGAVGCSSQTIYPGDRVSNAAVIVVNNANTVHSSITVHVLAPDGERRRLGTVNLNERRSFTLRRANLAGTYQLLAEPLGQRRFLSHRFTLREGDAVEWNLRRNFVELRGTIAGED